MEKYGETAVNYNRDVETFPILKNILSKVSNKDIYNSPTDMGVNMVGFCISNNDVVEEASKKEIVRRYYNELNNYKLGLCDDLDHCMQTATMENCGNTKKDARDGKSYTTGLGHHFPIHVVSGINWWYNSKNIYEREKNIKKK